MFYDCGELTNIYFITPNENGLPQDLVDITGIVKLPKSNLTTIGESAFYGTTSIQELHIYNNVSNVNSGIVYGWTHEQTVFIHNENKLLEWNSENETGWHPQWIQGSACTTSYDKEYYILSFDADGGTVEFDEMDVVYEEPIGELPVAEKANSRLVGWFTMDGQQYTADTTYKLQEDLTLYAHWVEEYTIVFMKEGGTGGTDSVIATFNQKLPKIDKPSKAGSDFKGYWTTRDTTGKQYYDENMNGAIWDKQDNIKLYAHWQERIYKVKLDPNGGNGEPIFIETKYGALLTHEEKPTKANYDFVGYYSEKDCNGDKYYDENMNGVMEWLLESDGTLYAGWVLHEYTITYRIDNGNYDTSVLPKTYTIESNDIDYVSVKSNGQKIVWYPSHIDCSESYQDITVVGIWSEIVTKINYILDGGVNNSSNPKTITYTQNITLSDPTYADDEFLGWYLNENQVKQLYQLTEDEITLVAKWASEHITLVSGKTSINVNSKMAIVNVNELIRGCQVKISSSVSRIRFKSNGSYHYISIKVSTRSTPLNLILDNISLRGYSVVQEAIITGQKIRVVYDPIMSSSDLDIETYGTVNIMGASGARINLSGSIITGWGDPTECTNGSVAISGKNISIKNYGYLKIYGGDGGNGSTELSGVPCDGGNGAYAITANTININKVGYSLYIVGGNGGNSSGSNSVGKGSAACKGPVGLPSSDYLFIIKGTDGIKV